MRTAKYYTQHQVKDTDYSNYKFYKKIGKAEQRRLYKIIEPLLIECREAGFKTVDSVIASHPRHRGALKARSELILSLNGLITRLALNRGIRAEEVEDVISHCTVYLDKALMRFEYDRNFAFTSFAFIYLKGAILDFIRKNSLIVIGTKDFQEQKGMYQFISTPDIELPPCDSDTVSYILSSLSDDDARLIIWHFRLNEGSQFKDTLVTLMRDGIDYSEEKVNLIVQELKGVFSNE